MSEAKRTKPEGPRRDPDWRPYCLVCDTMLRMRKTDYGYQCIACGNEINHDLTRHHPAPASPARGE